MPTFDPDITIATSTDPTTSIELALPDGEVGDQLIGAFVIYGGGELTFDQGFTVMDAVSTGNSTMYLMERTRTGTEPPTVSWVGGAEDGARGAWIGNFPPGTYIVPWAGEIGNFGGGTTIDIPDANYDGIPEPVLVTGQVVIVAYSSTDYDVPGNIAPLAGGSDFDFVGSSNGVLDICVGWHSVASSSYVTYALNEGFDYRSAAVIALGGTLTPPAGTSSGWLVGWH